MLENKQETPPLRRHRPFYKHPLFWLFLIILAIAGIVFAILHFTKKPAESSSSSPSQSTTVATVPTSSESSKTSPAPSSVPSDDKTPSAYDGEDPNESTSLTGFLSTARFDGDKLVLRTTIDQYLADGICKLQVSDDAGHALEKIANLTPIASTSSCEGFDVSGSELENFSRPLYIIINLTSGNRTGTIEGSVE